MKSGRCRDFGLDAPEQIDLNLLVAKRAKGLAYAELGHTTEVHQTYLSGIEQGHRNPSVVVLQRIATALGADIEDVTKRRPGRKR